VTDALILLGLAVAEAALLLSIRRDVRAGIDWLQQGRGYAGDSMRRDRKD
jgi:hypothetical protein